MSDDNTCSYNVTMMSPDSFSKKPLKHPVKCIETGRVFESVAAAARWTRVSTAAYIRQAIRNGTATGGYHWWYADQPLPPDDFFKKPQKRPVRCVETGEVFESISAAARWAGVKSASQITYAIKHNGTSGGYHWEYV